MSIRLFQKNNGKIKELKGNKIYYCGDNKKLKKIKGFGSKKTGTTAYSTINKYYSPYDQRNLYNEYYIDFINDNIQISALTSEVAKKLGFEEYKYGIALPFYKYHKSKLKAEKIENTDSIILKYYLSQKKEFNIFDLYDIKPIIGDLNLAFCLALAEYKSLNTNFPVTIEFIVIDEIHIPIQFSSFVFPNKNVKIHFRSLLDNSNEIAPNGLTRKDSKGTIKFLGLNNGEASLYINSAMEFSDLYIVAESENFNSDSSSGIRIFAQECPLTLGENLKMNNKNIISYNDNFSINGAKIYVYGGYDCPVEDTSFYNKKINTNITINSGEYWYVAGWNRMRTQTHSLESSRQIFQEMSGTAKININQLGNSGIKIYWLSGFSGGPQHLLAASNIEIKISNNVLIYIVSPSTQNSINKFFNKEKNYISTIILKDNTNSLDIKNFNHEIDNSGIFIKSKIELNVSEISDTIQKENLINNFTKKFLGTNSDIVEYTIIQS